ncbi:hypothetical protein OPV22_024983 [Ensete ventricosum]|uniref:Uncharacterized protein n=1 Tax=Ensete ventricosum TaxID=4639 RepID=A0AAV8P7W9_ENSVE|nr:hypothetical protein OPV22_024983 [Ensete ventricosum]
MGVEADKAKGSRGKRGPSRKGSFFLEGNVVWLEAIFSFTVVACEEISDQASFPSITASISTSSDPASLTLISSPVLADLQADLPGRLPSDTWRAQLHDEVIRSSIHGHLSIANLLYSVKTREMSSICSHSGYSRPEMLGIQCDNKTLWH